MELLILYSEALLLVLLLLLDKWKIADCYDPLDPGGNITVTFDIPRWTDDGYMARVTVQNYYQYRHVQNPGWRLGWTWVGKEVIWSMAGAMAVHEGDCSEFKTSIPHSCERKPAVVDLGPEAAGSNWSAGCCHGGLLAARAIDYPGSFSSFDMYIGNLVDVNTSVVKPENLTLAAPGPGYTCGPLEDAKPTVTEVEGGKREEQVFRTWKSTCTYSPFVANETPACCVSLSAFYNPIVTPCPDCSCGCSDNKGPTCVGGSEMKSTTVSSQLQTVGCTGHMCPIRVHWHVMSNYRDQWRAKVTVSNYRYSANYSDWNLVIQHPGLGSTAKAYSFNSARLSMQGNIDEAAIFWGIDYYNKELLEAGKGTPGSVTTDILVDKDRHTFTLHNGWAYPRRVYFDGDECVMPAPDRYPGLPNGSSGPPNGSSYFLFLVLLSLFLVL